MRGRDVKHISLTLLASLFGGGKGSHALDETTWQAVMGLPLFDGLLAAEQVRLRELATQLLADKAFSGAGGIEVDDGMATAIAAFAVLPVLNIGYDWYEGWREIVVYPGEFIHDGEHMDEAGIVHHVRDVRSGEAMQGGPMVLSWEDVEHSGQGEGFNVVIHEFAHKLDMMNGDANGRPPLHSGMVPADWAREFQSAYDDLCRRVDGGEDTVIDPYATESPAEFFAVLSEYFFEAPELLQLGCPAVYGLLASFYRQDPLVRRRSI
ncbi:MAG: zinc-dependent peptidase [Nitrosomonadales bacterium]|nr:zinc-dependent peptidase [Nitrosomonadales bacterium]